ncbi:hypothetical protein BASA61_005298 [Batrachochytrium salamandrivorans]|nr:hypothetical protein BASA61_005298 [Batrachochytrium salamandrivorans]
MAPISKPICSASASSIYDPTQSQCIICPQNVVSGRTSSCSCSIGLHQLGISCTACSLPQIPSNDGTFCISCPAAAPATQIVVQNSAFSICACPQGQYFADRDASGAPMATGVCTLCASGHYPSQDLATCIPCPDPSNMIAVYSSGSYTCSCLTGGGLTGAPQGIACLSSSTVSGVISTIGQVDASLSFKDMIDVNGNPTSANLQSETISTNYMRAIGKCQSDGSLQYCELLANLCVLAMYDQSNKLCAAYLGLAKGRPSTLLSPYDDQPLGLPWLYYGIVNHELPQTTQQRVPNLIIDVTGVSGRSYLPLVLGVYHLNGSFLGYRAVTTELQMCRNEGSKPSNWSMIARDHTSSCTLNLFNLISQNYATYFYELFLVQTSGQLYPVPVRIANFRSTSGVQVNLNPSPGDWSGSQLVRRFFLVDTASGVVNGATTIVRIPSSISITVTKAGGIGKITLPIVDITYTERDISAISPSDKSIFSAPLISFSVSYIQDYYTIRQVLTITFSILVSFGFIYTFYTTRLWSSRNLGPYDSIDIWRAIFLHSIFIHRRISVDDFDSGYSFCRGSNHIFFIDWERSKGLIVSPGNDITTAATSPVSIWRSIFMANQWNALQTYQRIYVGHTLIALLAILEGTGLRYLSATRAGFADLSADTTNPFLLVAIDLFFWVLLLVLQMVVKSIYERLHPNKLLQYIDILSLANVSMLIFDAPCHGYYVHGRSVHSYADTNMMELNNFLKKEENDMVPRRGLQDTNQQSFEIFVTRKMRSTFDKIFDQNTVLPQGTQRLKKMSDRLTMNAVKIKGSKDSITPANELQIKEYKQVNDFLRSLSTRYQILPNLKENPYLIREKTYFEQFAVSPDQSEGNVFFPAETGFSHTLLYGIEMHMTIAYMYIFVYVDILTDSPSKAALVVWVVHFLIGFARGALGEKNLARKTLLDWRFLV